MFRPTVHGCEAIKSIHTSESVRTNWRWDIWIYSFCFHIFSQRRKSISTPISNGHDTRVLWESIHKPKNMKSHFSVFPIWISLNVLWAMSSKGINDSTNEKKQIELNEKNFWKENSAETLCNLHIYWISRKNSCTQCSFYLWFIFIFGCSTFGSIRTFFFLSLVLACCASTKFLMTFVGSNQRINGRPEAYVLRNSFNINEKDIYKVS